MKNVFIMLTLVFLALGVWFAQTGWPGSGWVAIVCVACAQTSVWGYDVSHTLTR